MKILSIYICRKHSRDTIYYLFLIKRFLREEDVNWRGNGKENILKNVT